MTQMAADIFINTNNRRCLCLSEHDGWASRRPPYAWMAAISYDWANDLFGINESDEPIQPGIILPMGNESPRPSNIHSYMESHKHELDVIYECPCIADNKLRHHPDYAKPLQVMMLCPKCHGREHSKINKQAKATLITMIAVKRIFNSRIEAL